MINLDQQKMIVVPFSEDNNVSGFYYRESDTVYLSAQSCLLILGITYTRKKKNRLQSRWATLHQRFYSGWSKVGCPPFEIPFMNSQSKYASDLPMYIQDYVMEKMCNISQDSISKYQKLKDICEEIKQKTIMGEFIMKQNEKDTNNKQSEPTGWFTLDYSKLKYQNFQFYSQEIQGFSWLVHTIYYDECIYINTRDAAIMMGLFRIQRNNKIMVRWDNLYKYYTKHCTIFNLSYEQTGIDASNPRETNANTSPLELKMPEFLTKEVVLDIISKLDNKIAKEFSRDLLSQVVPFFDNFATSTQFSDLGTFSYDDNQTMRRDMIQSKTDTESLNEYKYQLFQQIISRIALIRGVHHEIVENHLCDIVGASCVEDIAEDYTLGVQAYSILIADMNQAAAQRQVINKNFENVAKKMNINKPLKTVVEFAIQYNNQNE